MLSTSAVVEGSSMRIFHTSPSLMSPCEYKRDMISTIISALGSEMDSP